MSDDRDSLVEREAQQLELISSADMAGDYFSGEEMRGHYTGERLFRRDPEKYRLVASLLAEGLGPRAIKRITGCDARTIAAVGEREPKLITTEKQRLGQLARTGARMLTEAIVEAAQDIRLLNMGDLRDAAVVFGILTDKSELLLGGVTQRIEHTGGDPLRDAKSVLEDLERAYGAGEIIDVDTTGLVAGERGTKEGGVEPPGDPP